MKVEEAAGSEGMTCSEGGVVRVEALGEEAEVVALSLGVERREGPGVATGSGEPGDGGRYSGALRVAMMARFLGSVVQWRCGRRVEALT